MNCGRRVVIALLLMMVMILAPGLGLAQVQGSQDGLEFVLSTNKDDYTATEAIEATLTVTNTGTETARNVSITGEAPSGYSAAGGADFGKYESIAPGASRTYTVTYMPDGLLLPQTGDNSSLLLWAALASGCACALYFIVKKRLYKQTMSILLCLALLSPTIAGVDLSAKAMAETGVAGISGYVLEKQVKADGKELNLRFTISYSHSYLTRGEWIQRLMDTFITDTTVSRQDVNYAYPDIVDHPNGYAIQLAKGFGILPPDDVEDPVQDVPLFNPDGIADRDFLAYTAAAAMGFTGEHQFDTSAWQDISSSRYPNMAAIAVGFGMLTLDAQNRFNPRNGVTTGMADQAIDAMKEIEASANLENVSPYDNTQYVQGVVRDQIAHVTDYQVAAQPGSDGRYLVTIPAASMVSDIAPGKVIVLPSTNDCPGGIALKVEQIRSQGDTVQLICSTPQLHEVVSSIDFVDVGRPVYSQITAADESIRVSYSPNTKGDLYPLTINKGGEYDLGKLTFEFPDEGYKIKESLKVKGSLEIQIPKVTAKVVAHIGLFNSSLDEFTLTMSEEAVVKGELIYQGTGDYGTTKMEDRVELGRIPFILGNGFSFDLVFFFKYEAKGTLSVEYEFDATQGFQYKNGAPRIISSFGHDLKMLEIAATAKIGMGLSGMLVFCSIWDLIGYQANGGAGFNASLTPHLLGNEPLICGDITLYGYLDSGLDTETIIGEILEKVFHYKLEFEHLKNDKDNPFKLKLHVENLKRVPECTYDGGGLEGQVVDALTGQPIRYARVTIYRTETGADAVDHILYTNSNGVFSADELHRGHYKAVVTATGYKNYELEFDMDTAGTKYLECQMLVDRDQVEIGTITCKVTDALTGAGVTGASYELRKGWSITTGTTVRTGTITGSSIDLSAEPGNYTMLIKKDGYISNYVNVAVVSKACVLANVVLSPVGTGMASDELRMVLTWGQYPEDLDSHLFAAGGTSYHIFYNDKTHYSGSTLIANLDVDDITSYGPETTTINRTDDSTKYSFYVHDYTNRSSTSSVALSNSGAKVQVYMDNTLLGTFNVPMNREGTVWHVFDYDTATDTFTPVNTFDYSDDPGSLAPMTFARSLRSAPQTGLSEITAVQMIHDSAASVEKN